MNETNKNQEPVINRDYIGVIETRNGTVLHARYEIEKPCDLVVNLQQTLEDSEKSVLDLQRLMLDQYPDGPDRCYSYVYPADYRSAYVNAKGLSKPMTQNELSDREQEVEESSGEQYDSIAEEIAEDGRAPMKVTRAEYVASCVEEWRENLKKEYYRKSIDYIRAASYAKKRRELEQREEVKMCSTDRIGWPIARSRCLRYDITSDISIAVFSNFGYGRSSYFYIALTYKGIDILPYSMLVKYFYASSADLARYTRRYAEDRRSWNLAFDFVEEVANFAMREPENFIHQWVRNEVDETVRGLREIVQMDQSSVVARIGRFSTEEAEMPEYITVRNISSQERCVYKAYPWEMAMAWRAEKITSSLAFLKPMLALKPIYDEVDAAIAEIRQMAVDILPEVERTIEAISRDVASLERDLLSKKSELSEIDARLLPHRKELEKRYDPVEQRLKKGLMTSWDANKAKEEIRRRYGAANPVYNDLIAEWNAKSAEIAEVERDVLQRRNFISRLTACRDVIGQAGLMAA